MKVNALQTIGIERRPRAALQVRVECVSAAVC
jgi:hypothetical protein